MRQVLLAAWNMWSVITRRVDRMVERDRALAVRDILACLRIKTGEDLGDSPEAWIQKYAKR
jgi:hypothetical protein